ncbi:AraC family transcriptional regulator [Niabella sp. CC-SYL272]|uniref:helix-turn-helix domain-containing protein n=1 Tax=Niabella agricola TaxID=2891571 RepID=UPI001F25D11B|nr:AraC family transcriptional regulator [Niabella agricola]MCF3108791.1 AraC family transcriptional regulator [Niabella agricola]
MDKDLVYKWIGPDPSLADFVEGFWFLENRSGAVKEIVVLPDGRVDCILAQPITAPFYITLLGIGTLPDNVMITAGIKMCAISFKLPAVEYIFHHSVSRLLNTAAFLPAGFWDFNATDLVDLERFRKKATEKIRSAFPGQTDNRKLELFRLIYRSKGALTVKALSESVFWSSRQINRYFQQQFGLSLKTYCSILRFRASFQHLRAGKLFPEENFADQSHFIREVKKRSGVLPKELSRNQNDRFIQFTTLGAE